MKRQLDHLLVIALLLVLPAACTQQDQKQESLQKPPNILLIVADDMGYSDIGSFGAEIATPALDAIAAEGMKLTNFHVMPSCSPTRSILLSGVDNHLAGLGTMAEWLTPEMAGIPGYEGHLNYDVAALPEVLKAGGYHTYMTGKWHLGKEDNLIPAARGFEESYAILGGGGSHWSDQKGVSPIEPMTYKYNNETIEQLPEDFYSTKFFTDQMLEWLERDLDDGKPFFSYLAYTAPHDPLHAPEEYIEKYKGKYDAGWDVFREQRFDGLKKLGIINDDAVAFPRLPMVKPWEELSEEEKAMAARDMEVYAAMIDYMDEQIKRVTDFLKEKDEYDNTLILFFSDHGASGTRAEAYGGQTEEFLESFDNSLENRGLKNSLIEPGPGWAQVSMAPSRMFKVFTAEGGIKSPMLVKMPGTMQNAGSMSDALLHVRDIMPTILDVAGIEQPAGEFMGREVKDIQGSSLKDFFDGTADAPVATAQVGYELFGMKAYFDNQWKILLLPKPFGSGDWELFDLARDPAELNDLSEVNPEKRAELIAKWEAYKQENGVRDLASLDLSDKVN